MFTEFKWVGCEMQIEIFYAAFVSFRVYKKLGVIELF